MSKNKKLIFKRALIVGNKSKQNFSDLLAKALAKVTKAKQRTEQLDDGIFRLINFHELHDKKMQVGELIFYTKGEVQAYAKLGNKNVLDLDALQAPDLSLIHI